jgi:lipoate---protein ligase
MTMTMNERGPSAGHHPFTLYLSHDLDPMTNLALEAWLFERAPLTSPILFLWRNASTVVIGRAQNPWLECDLDQMQRDHVTLARRVSGGGAVFHDLGNTNFTFIHPTQAYDRHRNLTLLCELLQSLGIPAEVSGRNDLQVPSPDTPGGYRKISGNAFRETKDRCLHHGTLLMNADLARLTRYLTPSPKKLMTKGIPSVRSRVMNLREINPSLTHATDTSRSA